MLLALDTATHAVTVALHDGTAVVAQETALDTRRHTELLAPTVQTVLRRAGITPAGLDAVAVGVGPGPFTGLRVGIVTATTLAHALGIPVLGVCSLDAIAHEAATTGGPDELLVATDARRQEVYWARYVRDRDGTVVRDGEPEVGRACDLPPAVRALPCAGRGAVLHPGDLGPALDVLDVSAGALAVVALAARERGEVLDPRPLYLRRPDAQPQGPRRPVS